MAEADYRQCDVCGGKSFYDANLHYPDIWEDEPLPSGTGDWAVICVECAKNYRCVVEMREDRK